jgi:AraC-like DNA-binding protein
MTKKKVLFFENDMSLVNSLMLSIGEQYEFLLISRLTDAQEKVRSGNADIIIINPAVADEPFSLIRQAKKWAIPNIVITHQSSEKLAIRSLNAGASHYLKKPVSLEDMIHTVKKVAGEPETQLDSIEKIRYFLCENYMNKIYIKDLCTVVKTSRQKLFYHFKKRYKKGVLAYLRDIRMKRALELLITSDLHVSDISQAVGYKHVGYFCREFKKYYKKTPTEMRTAERKKRKATP